MSDLYKRCDTNTVIEACPLCGAHAFVYAYSEDFENGSQKVVMCANYSGIGERDNNLLDGCFLQMPPKDFYKGRIIDAITYWNTYAKSLKSTRRKREWDRHSATRDGESEQL